MKIKDSQRVQPNLPDYEHSCATFSWDDIHRELDGLPGGKGTNIAHEAVDRHANGPLAEHLAIRWLGGSGAVLDYTYKDLQEQSNRFANILQQLGVKKSERVSALTGRMEPLILVMWKRLPQPVNLWRKPQSGQCLMRLRKTNSSSACGVP